MTEFSNINIGDHTKEALRANHELLPERLREFADIVDGVSRFCELLEGLYNDSDYEFLSRRMDFLDEEVSELREAIKQQDDLEILDGAIDVAFVAIGQAYHLLRQKGHDHYAAKMRTRSAFIEVCRSNLTKALPTEKGAKIKKPLSFSEAKLQHLLDKPTLEGNS